MTLRVLLRNPVEANKPIKVVGPGVMQVGDSQIDLKRSWKSFINMGVCSCDIFTAFNHSSLISALSCSGSRWWLNDQIRKYDQLSLLDIVAYRCKPKEVPEKAGIERKKQKTKQSHTHPCHESQTVCTLLALHCQYTTIPELWNRVMGCWLHTQPHLKLDHVQRCYHTLAKWEKQRSRPKCWLSCLCWTKVASSQCIGL